MLERSNGHRINQVDILAGNGRLCFGNREKMKELKKCFLGMSPELQGGEGLGVKI